MLGNDIQKFYFRIKIEYNLFFQHYPKKIVVFKKWVRILKDFNNAKCMLEFRNR